MVNSWWKISKGKKGKEAFFRMLNFFLKYSFIFCAQKCYTNFYLPLFLGGGNWNSWHFKLKVEKHYKSHYKIILISCAIHSFIDSIHSGIRLFANSFTYSLRVPTWTQTRRRETKVISAHCCFDLFWMIQTSPEDTYNTSREDINRQLCKDQQWCERISLQDMIFTSFTPRRPIL